MKCLPEPPFARLRVLVHGRVQGVNFRSFVYTHARALHLTGYVRNLEDGRTVQVVSEGQRADLEQLLEHLREGPRGARVDGVDVRWGEANGSYRDFSLTH